MATPTLTEASAVGRVRAVLRGISRTLARSPGATGASVACAHPRIGLVTDVAGTSARDGRTPITAGTRFLGGSVGKTFVAAAALVLDRSGGLPLDAPIRHWLGAEPWFDAIPNGDRITTRMLLRHTGGLANHLEQPAYAALLARGGVTPGMAHRIEQIRIAAAASPLAQPGTAFHYGDTNYILAGVVIERASGRDVYGLIQELFLTPLALDATVPSSTALIPDLADGHRAPQDPFDAFGHPAVLNQGGRLVYDPGLEWTGGGFATTPGDLARWASFLYRGRIIPASCLAEMVVPGPGPLDTPDKGVRYGLGVFLTPTPSGLLWGHGGIIPGYRTHMSFSPGDALAFATQVNVTDYPRTQSDTEQWMRQLSDAVQGGTECSSL